jgi:cell division protein FtsI/penicillin-binding protein 2
MHFRSVINFNSPMMNRVARNGVNQTTSFSLPRKGRIRLFLVLAFIIFLVRFLPAVIHKMELPSDRLNKNRTTEKTAGLHSLQSRMQVSGISEQLSQQPASLSSIHAITLSGDDSLIVHTSIDTALKSHCEKLMSRYDPLYGAMAALDPVTGRILSLISYTNDSMPDLGANLCLKSFFPAASTFKTITAAAAIEYEDFSSGCILEHRGRTSTLYNSQISRELDWTVDITFSQAYSRSVNAVFARIGLYEVGKERLLNIANAFGFNTALPGELECERSLALCNDSVFEIAEFASGFNQRTTISPLHGALIAAAISGDGSLPVPTLVDSIVEQKSGHKKYERVPAVWRRAMQSSTADEMQRLMQTVAISGTARKHFKNIKNSDRFSDFIYGGKTGSVDKDHVGRVDWFIGFAMHPQRIDERIAVGVLTVHGAYWTVHSSYLAAEAMRFYLKSLQEQKKAAPVEKVVQLIDTTRSPGQ